MNNKTIFDEHWLNAKTGHPDSWFEIVEHGWEQHVLVDHQRNLVYRYPRNKNAKAKLDDEVQVLSELHGIVFNLAIPVIEEHSNDFTLYKYIPGDVMDEKTIKSLSNEQVEKIGTDLGVFLSILHSASPEIVKSKKTKQTMSLYQYYAQRIEKSLGSDFYIHAKKLLEKIEYEQTDEVVVHGDLHGLNMVVDPINAQLVGVIDFSELELGNRFQDFRKLFMTDRRLLDSALRSYSEKTGNNLDKEVILAWAYVNEWANIAYFKDQQNNPTYIRAQKHLKLWDEL